ncbi:MAG TPA: redoxin domain-containing protein [Solirubrobacteraceae bacterium]|nr:redoxin domain-containing protein [Solirubrobacteraceae bacterium]
MTTSIQLPVEAELPSLVGATGWLNSPPLSPERLHGRPVLVEFWTFTCINWIRTLPYVRSWYEKYRHDGLIVLGVHTPEFEVERDIEHVRRAVQRMRIEYPIAVDSDYRIWRALGNQYWPALYFADADGQIRHHRFGEGEYEYSELVIQLLLRAAGAPNVSRKLAPVDAREAEATADWENLRSPETYIGYARADNFASPGDSVRDQPHEYALPDALGLNRWALDGDWTIGPQAAVLNASGGRIAHRFRARDLHLVMAPRPHSQPVRFRVLLDGDLPRASCGIDTDERGQGTVTEPRLYQLIRQPGDIRGRTFEITFLDRGVQAYVFTFG